MLNETLENLEEDAGAHRECSFKHLDLSLAHAHGQRVILHKHVRERAELENDALDSLVHAVQLIEIRAQHSLTLH